MKQGKPEKIVEFIKEGAYNNELKRQYAMGINVGNNKTIDQHEVWLRSVVEGELRKDKLKEISSVELLPFADADWRKDKFTWDDDTLMKLSANIGASINTHIKKVLLGSE